MKKTGKRKLNLIKNTTRVLTAYDLRDIVGGTNQTETCETFFCTDMCTPSKKIDLE